MITWNGFSLNNGGATLIPKGGHIVTEPGFIFYSKVAVSGAIYLDPWFDAVKDYVGSYITYAPSGEHTELKNDYRVNISAGYNNVYLSDAAWSATSANSAGAYYPRRIYCVDDRVNYSTYKIERFDFWHQSQFWNRRYFVSKNPFLTYDCILPSDPIAFARCENMIGINLASNSYSEIPSNIPVSTSYPDRYARTMFNSGGNIEPFITAFKAACPNASGNGLRYNYSPDYDHCCTAYPDWYRA
jgi:hypothetical protein